MYSEKVMDHFNHPRNVGEMENPSGVGTVGNAKCGDIMRMYLDIDDNGIIKEAKFKTFGCGAAVATSSMATELVKGKTIQEALEVTNKAVMEALDGLPPVKVHCSLLAEEAIHAALWDYAEKNGIKIEGLERPVNDISEKEEEEEVRLQHHDLIDSFIKNEEQRTPGSGLNLDMETTGAPVPGNLAELEENQHKPLDDSYFTETLAHIYVKQKRYEKALQIIKNLNLKYPEKNVYFADQIRFLEKLIINTKK